ncbi:MAG TPA: IPT/TIG domain-containing protein [Terriglobales bacterium]|jgi:hypothetical protein|nr:IPT/TIG domain-containing protein [Terriglobales bacterium]
MPRDYSPVRRFIGAKSTSLFVLVVALVACGGGGGTSTPAAPLKTPSITSFVPTSGLAGDSVTITGTNLSATSAVRFNGTTATFTVSSGTSVTASVPAGATTGKITVTTSSGTATSTANFTVNTSSGTLDLTVDGLYVTQATQNYPSPAVPLVKDRSAWVRVFVRANNPNSVTPQVRVRFITGATTNTLTINAPAASVPTSIDANTSNSWDAAVPSAWIQPSTQVIADVDPSGLIQESNKGNNSFTANLDVRTLKQWKITLVPVKTGSLTGSVTSATRTKESWLDTAQRLHPVPDAIDIAVGSTMTSSATNLTSSGTGWSTVLNELDAKRTADGATSRYYFGVVHVSYTSGVAGLGFVGHPAAIGWDFFPSATYVLAHEEGHNFGREHSPCGGASNPDPNYPYNLGIIGVPGWDVFATNGNLKNESTYTDIMGYCNTQWISDYTYKGELAFRAASSLGDVVPDVTNATTEDGLLIWGRIEDGKVTLEPAFRTRFTGERPTPGQYQIEARDLAGNVLSTQSFEAYQIDDLPEGQSVRLFSFVLPLSAAGMRSVAGLRLATRDGQELTRRVTRESTPELSEAAPQAETAVQTIELPNHSMQFRWDAERYPVLMIRDQKTGEVRGFLRGGQAEMEDAPADLDLQLSDGVRSRRQTHHRVTD